MVSVLRSMPGAMGAWQSSDVCYYDCMNLGTIVDAVFGRRTKMLPLMMIMTTVSRGSYCILLDQLGCCANVERLLHTHSIPSSDSEQRENIID